jgi:hypothetical protein
MSYIREKLFAMKSMAFFTFFSIWNSVSQIKKKMPRRTIARFRMAEKHCTALLGRVALRA